MKAHSFVAAESPVQEKGWKRADLVSIQTGDKSFETNVSPDLMESLHRLILHVDAPKLAPAAAAPVRGGSRGAIGAGLTAAELKQVRTGELSLWASGTDLGDALVFVKQQPCASGMSETAVKRWAAARVYEENGAQLYGKDPPPPETPLTGSRWPQAAWAQTLQMPPQRVSPGREPLLRPRLRHPASRSKCRFLTDNSHRRKVL